MTNPLDQFFAAQARFFRAGLAVFYSGVCWLRMYCLSVSSGAPPLLADVAGELDRMRTLLELDLDRRTGRSRPDPAKDAREASKRGPDAAASAWAKARMGKTPPNPRQTLRQYVHCE